MTENLKVLITEDEIQDKVQDVASKIQSDYQDKDLVIVMVMKGALIFVSDLIRELDIPLHIEFVQCSSYGGTKRGKLNIFGIDRLDVKNRDVLIVDDIFDSGHTMAGLYDAIQELGPRSIKSCVLLEKKTAHVTEIRPDYVLFDIEDRFVVGYGLDYNERYRGLPGVYELTEED